MTGQLRALQPRSPAWISTDNQGANGAPFREAVLVGTCYANADLRKGEEAEEIFRSIDFWPRQHGAPPRHRCPSRRAGARSQVEETQRNI